MQVTLVAHYGAKPRGLATLVERLHRRLGESFGPAFCPYELRQVHCTIAGLEAHRVNGGLKHDRSGSALDLDGLVGFLRGPDFAPIHVRVGGFTSDASVPFRSRDAHPHQRSFSVQGDTAVAMGWPALGDDFPDSLDRLRRSLQQFGVRHKWHTTPEDVDNDCFLVLGRVDRAGIDAGAAVSAEESIRAELATTAQATLEISRDTLSFVGYVDPRLPIETSRAYRLDEPDLGMKLEALY
jgi:hypothetical protein